MRSHLSERADSEQPVGPILENICESVSTWLYTHYTVCTCMYCTIYNNNKPYIESTTVLSDIVCFTCCTFYSAIGIVLVTFICIIIITHTHSHTHTHTHTRRSCVMHV